jgi:hypothetical protein
MLLTDPEFTMPQRIRCLTQLASALAAAHTRQVVLGGFRPDLLYWNSTTRHLRIPFPLSIRLLPPAPEFHAIPIAPPRPPPGQDVAHWAQVGTLLLDVPLFSSSSPSEAPTRSGQEQRLAFLVSSCLGDDSSLWPSNGIELLHLVEETRSAPPEEFQATKIQKKNARKELQHLHENTQSIAIEEDMLASRFDLQSLKEVATEASGQLAQAAPGRGRGIVIGSVGLLLLGLFLKSMVPLFYSSKTSRVSAYQPAKAAEDSLKDLSPALRRLLETKEVTQETFLRVWYRLRGLIIAGEISKKLVPTSDLQALKKRFPKEPAISCKELTTWIEKVREQARQSQDSEEP